MAKAPPSFQFYPGDWIGGTEDLSLEAEGLYIRILARLWAKVEVDFDPKSLAKLCRLDVRTWRRVWREIEDKFIVTDDGLLVNQRLESIRRQALARSARRRKPEEEGGGSSERSGVDVQIPEHAKLPLSAEDRRQKINNKDNCLDSIDDAVLRSTVVAWINHKDERGETYSKSGREAIIQWIADKATRYGAPQVSACIQRVIRNNWGTLDDDRNWSNVRVPKRKKYYAPPPDINKTTEEDEDFLRQLREAKEKMASRSRLAKRKDAIC